ncbi:hypothetical protein BC833DRAFT_621264 [Globomyces pollinis-pini]|nr:hypothetical protein BC833DRAFT_621264 [Globomyces pollinis-pini]
MQLFFTTLLSVVLGVSFTNFKRGYGEIKPDNLPINYLPTFAQDENLSQENALDVRFNYYGGPVVTNVKVYSIFWGGKSKVTYADQINKFYEAITKSTMMDILQEYNTPTQKIGRGSFLGEYSYDDAAIGVVTDDQIQTALKNLVVAGKIPPPDGNMYYAIHFRPSVSIYAPFGVSCITFCGYHGTARHEGKLIYYGIMPDFGGTCATGCGSKFESVTRVSSHELVEVVTDPAVGIAVNGQSAPLAWYDPLNGEIADPCNSKGVVPVLCENGETFHVQRIWSNKANGCTMWQNLTTPITTASTKTTTIKLATTTTTKTTTKPTTTTTKTTTTTTTTKTTTKPTTTTTTTKTTTKPTTTTTTTTKTTTKPTTTTTTTTKTTTKPTTTTTTTTKTTTKPTTTTKTTTTTTKTTTLPTTTTKTTTKPTTTTTKTTTSTSKTTTAQKTTTTTKSTTIPTSSCAHNICLTGGALPSSCDPCVAKIIAVDQYCAIFWDGICVGQVLSVCGLDVCFRN